MIDDALTVRCYLFGELHQVDLNMVDRDGKGYKYCVGAPRR
jgi:hypothetical protein